MTRSRLTSIALSFMLWSGIIILALSHKISAIVTAIDFREPIPVVTETRPTPPPPPLPEIKHTPEPPIAPLTPQVEPTPTPIPVPETYQASPAPAQVTGAKWLQRPGAREIDRYYPSRAAERGMEGRVLLNCTVNADGTINCVVASETPEGWGFGTAAMQVSRYFKMAPLTVNGDATSGGTIDVPLAFRLGN